MAAPADAALQDRLQRRKVVIVGGKAQVINKEDEFQRILCQLVHQGGDLVELVLLHLDQAQAVGRKLVGNCLDRAGLARARIAVEQHVIGRAALQQGAGVGNDLLALLLVAGQLAQTLRVGVAHRHQMPVLQRKDMVAGKHAVALLAHGRTARPIGRVVVGVGRCLPPRQEHCRAGEHLVQRRTAKRLQKVQLAVQRSLQHGPGILPGCHTQAEVFLLEHGIQQGLGPVGAAGKQRRLKRGDSARQGVLIRRQRHVQRAQRLRRQQAAEHHKPIQMGQPFITKHIHIPFPRDTLFTTSINAVAKSCKICCGIFKQVLTNLQKYGIVYHTFRQCVDGKLVTVPHPAESCRSVQGSRAADRELIPEQTTRNHSRAVRAHPLQCRALLEAHEVGALPQ